MDLLLNALKSKTIMGLLLAAFGQSSIGSDIVSTFGLTEDSGVTIIDTILTWVGLAIGVYGRTVAKKPLI